MPTARVTLARRLVVVAGLLAVMSFAFATRLQRALLFHPDAAPTHDEVAERVPGLERWWLETEQGRVEAWFVPGDGVSADAPGPLLIYAHGNAEVIDPLPLWLRPYRAMGISVLLPEYRGYGRSEGTPSEQAIREDLVAFHDRAVARPEVDASRVVLHGVSLGGGAVAQLASERMPAAMILQSTFTSVADIAWEQYRAPRFLIADRFDSIGLLRGASTPALIFHGRRDTLIPPAHAQRLHRALPRSELVECDAGHNDLPPPDLDYWGTIERFLVENGIVRRAR